MRILFISNDLYFQENYRNLLKDIAEPESIFFVYNGEETIKFLRNRTIEQQEPLDLVIIKSTEYSELVQSVKRFLILKLPIQIETSIWTLYRFFY